MRDVRTKSLSQFFGNRKNVEFYQVCPSSQMRLQELVAV